tara:strand:+ start:41 stop:910 length:870 start_codon:yes stop_codon:yes gene_type:complete
MSLQSDIHKVLDQLSNNEGDTLNIDDSWIEDAGEAFKDALRRQFAKREDEDFRLRMSNIGKPLCQLQMAKSGAKKGRKDYNFIMRMLHGDAVECIMDVILKIAKTNITGSKDKVALELEGTTVKGEDDVEIDNKVYDIKTCSPFAFDRKWKLGLPALKANDDFGYVGQLIGYSEAKSKKAGGWIVVCKSTGQVLVMDADFSNEEKDTVLQDMQMKATALKEDWSFDRCFEPVDDFFNKKFTGSKKLPISCSWCDFKESCWPNAKLLPQPKSRAKEPKKNWYVQYEGVEL